MEKAVGNQLQRHLDQLFQSGTLTGLSDAELLERYLTRRDEAAFEALVRLHGPMVMGLCRRILRDRGEIDDAFQATFLILVRKAPSLRDRRLLANWLYGVAYRVAIRLRKNAAKRDAGKQPAERLDELPGELETASSVEVRDLLPILDEELARLPEKYRRPIVLCHLDGRTHEQSAGQLGIPVGTMRSRLARGRELLKQRLERRGIAPGAIAIAFGGSPTAVKFAASVPASLVNGTLASAGQFVTISAVRIGSTASTVSAISLAQGVIMSMFVTQAKLALVGALATGAVVCGGAWAVSSSSGSKGGGIDPTTLAAPAYAPIDLKTSDASRDQVTSPPSAPRDVALLDRREGSNVGRQTRGPIYELEAELKVANQFYKQVQILHRQATVSSLEVERARGKIEIVEAQLKDLIENLEYDRAQLNLELTKAKAETRVQAARVKIASYERNIKLKLKASKVISDEGLGISEANFELARSQLESSQTDVDALAAKIELVDQRIRVAKAVLEKAEAIKKPADESKPTAPAPPGS